MPPNPDQPNGSLASVKGTQRLSVIRGPSNPPLMNITLGKLIRRQSRKHPDSVAVISQNQNEVITYSELHKYSDDLAAGMIALGVQRGDRVAVMLGNRSEYVYVRRSLYSTEEHINTEKSLQHQSASFSMCKDRGNHNLVELRLFLHRSY
jgi:non-ribosomal peptide synthetase component F